MGTFPVSVIFHFLPSPRSKYVLTFPLLSYKSVDKRWEGTIVAIDDKTPNWRHQLTLVDREELTIEGVISLGSYDEKEIIMETEQGMLTIKGDGLNIKQLSLDKENIIIDGNIRGLTYDEAIQSKKGLLGRLLK